MKKTLRSLTITAAALAALAACKKDDSKTPTPATDATTVTINGSTFTQYQSIDQAGASLFGHTVYELAGESKTSNGTSFADVYVLSLANLRPTAGSYNIGGNADGYRNNQLQLLVNDSTAAGQGLYASDSLTNLSITISATGGKLTATIPVIRLAGLFTPVNGSTYNDTITLAGTVKAP